MDIRRKTSRQDLPFMRRINLEPVHLSRSFSIGKHTGGDRGAHMWRCAYPGGPGWAGKQLTSILVDSCEARDAAKPSRAGGVLADEEGGAIEGDMGGSPPEKVGHETGVQEHYGETCTGPPLCGKEEDAAHGCHKCTP